MTFVDFKRYGGTTVARRFVPLALRGFFLWAARYRIPNIIATYAQLALYALFYRAAQRPSSSSTHFWRDRQRLYKAVVIAMFLLALYQVEWNIQREPNFYRVLGLHHDADHKSARANFRMLAKQYHPDKVTSKVDDLATNTWFRLRTAVNVIGDADLRRVYNNHGPLALDCTGDCRVNDKYISRARTQRMLFYMTCIPECTALVWRGKWRWIWIPSLLITTLAIVEIHADLTGPRLGMVSHAVASFFELTRLSSRYSKFEVIVLLRAVIKASFVALSQLRRMDTSMNMGEVVGAKVD